MKDLLYFLGGCVVGGALAVLAYKMKVSDPVIHDLEEDLERVGKEKRKLKKEAIANKPDCENCRYKKYYDEWEEAPNAKKKKVSEPIEEVTKQEEETIDYTDYYEEEDEENTELLKEADDARASEEYEAFHKLMSEEPPRLISFEDYIHLPYKIFVEEACLSYYTYDCVLLDEENNEIDDPEKIVGDVLMTYDFDKNPVKTLYVLNYQLDTCYEVTVYYESYMDND